MIREIEACESRDARDSEVAERMVRDAGFTRFVCRDFDDPANLYYEVRP